MRVTVNCPNADVTLTQEENAFVAEFQGNANASYFEITIDKEYDNQAFLLLPACAYDGNKFRVDPVNYPPYFTYDTCSPDMPVTITPRNHRLNPDGSGKICVSTAELSVPCIAVYDRTSHTAQYLFTCQELNGEALGYCFDNKIHIRYPKFRNDSVPYTHPVEDAGKEFRKGDRIRIEYRYFDVPCESMEEFYSFFFRHRKCMGLPGTYSRQQDLKEIWKVHEAKFNTVNYNPDTGIYMTGRLTEGGKYRANKHWQPGWTGGGISVYPLMKFGSPQTYARCKTTLDWLFRKQGNSGFFYGIVGEDGKPVSDAYAAKDVQPDWTLLRKSADMLYYLFDIFGVMEEKGDTVDAAYLAGTRKLADAFVRNINRYGQYGQFVSYETGEIFAGGTLSASIATAGLVKAGKYFHEPSYLEAAKEAGEHDYALFRAQGMTNGGPCEILQAPDSESAYGFLEAMAALYEATRDAKWLDRTKAVADYCSSWVVAYNFRFPEGSEFNRIDARTIGSVFANTQNKHSAPGICTYSGKALYSLYQWTEDPLYLELLKDTACNIFQYVCTEEKPIFSKERDGQRLPLIHGSVCERVNMSDWETTSRVGEVFNGANWPDVSSMVTLADLQDFFTEK